MSDCCPFFSLCQEWGMEVKLRKLVVLPCLKIKNFVMKTPQGTRTAKQWKEVQFPVEEFDFTEYVSNQFPDLGLE